jgi:hypothetical protein
VGVAPALLPPPSQPSPARGEEDFKSRYLPQSAEGEGNNFRVSSIFTYLDFYTDTIQPNGSGVVPHWMAVNAS